jgi:hypothetical protein
MFICEVSDIVLVKIINDEVIRVCVDHINIDMCHAYGMVSTVTNSLLLLWNFLRDWKHQCANE